MDGADGGDADAAVGPSREVAASTQLKLHGFEVWPLPCDTKERYSRGRGVFGRFGDNKAILPLVRDPLAGQDALTLLCGVKYSIARVVSLHDEGARV